MRIYLVGQGVGRKTHTQHVGYSAGCNKISAFYEAFLLMLWEVDANGKKGREVALEVAQTKRHLQDVL